MRNILNKILAFGLLGVDVVTFNTEKFKYEGKEKLICPLNKESYCLNYAISEGHGDVKECAQCKNCPLSIEEYQQQV